MTRYTTKASQPVKKNMKWMKPGMCKRNGRTPRHQNVAKQTDNEAPGVLRSSQATKANPSLPAGYG